MRPHCLLAAAAAIGLVAGCGQIPAGAVSLINDAAFPLDATVELPARQTLGLSTPVHRRYEFTAAPRTTWRSTGQPIRSERTNSSTAFMFEIRTREEHPRAWTLACNGHLVVSDVGGSGEFLFLDNRGEPVTPFPSEQSTPGGAAAR